MNRQKFLKLLLCLGSAGMFLYQSLHALKNLWFPPVVDSTDRLHITEVIPPLITICPYGQINTTILKEYGYDNMKQFLSGNDLLSPTLSWGGEYDMTFWDIFNESLTYNPETQVYLDIRFDYSSPLFSKDLTRKFYPKFGYCWELSDYPANALISMDILTEGNIKSPSYEVYITDRNLKTPITVEIETHKESLIHVRFPWVHTYEIKVELISHFDPLDPDSCYDYEEDEYENFMKEELEQLVKPIIGCNPDWLSLGDDCETFVGNFSEEYKNSTEMTLDMILEMKRFPSQELYKDPCIETRSYVKLRSKEKDANAYLTLDIQFDKEVIRTRKILAYNFSNFLIDIGSSLGLWFGLSVFGLTDMGMQFLLLCRQCFQSIISRI